MLATTILEIYYYDLDHRMKTSSTEVRALHMGDYTIDSIVILDIIGDGRCYVKVNVVIPKDPAIVHHPWDEVRAWYQPIDEPIDIRQCDTKGTYTCIIPCVYSREIPEDLYDTYLTGDNGRPLTAIFMNNYGSDPTKPRFISIRFERLFSNPGNSDGTNIVATELSPSGHLFCPFCITCQGCGTYPNRTL